MMGRAAIWRIDEAYELFEAALGLDPYHEYTLIYYPKFLETLGMNDNASILRQRYNEIESGKKFIEPADYDIDLDDVTDI
jgi:hypothetical protein